MTPARFQESLSRATRTNSSFGIQLGTFTQFDFEITRGINNAGQMLVGFADGSSGVLSSDGTFIQIDAPGARVTTLEGINNAGQIVGNADGRGFVYSGGIFTQIAVPASRFTSPKGINDAGQIVGMSDFSRHGFLYSAGTFTQIIVPGSRFTSPEDINDAGEIVGQYVDLMFRNHGFLYNGGTFTQIDVPGSLDSGILGINNAGQIVGAFSNLPEDLVGHAFLATPIPEPSTWLLLGSGLVSLVIWRRYAHT